MSNAAAWLLSKGQPSKVEPAEIPKPSEGELVIENRATPIHPGDWKLQRGIIPIELRYPTILGNYTAGFVHEVGPGVTRFKKGDRVLSMTAFSVRASPPDHRSGTHQRYSLSTELFTLHLDDSVKFENAVSAIIVYAAMSALVLHLGLDKPSQSATPKGRNVLIWGGGSDFGFYAVQIAAQAGYKVIATASPSKRNALLDAGAADVLDYHSPQILQDLIASGPYEAVLGANDSADSQVVIGKVLETQGGGRFNTTMGVRPGVVLPQGVTGFFVQYMNDYLNPEYEDFAKWVFWEYLEGGLKNGHLKLAGVEVVGGLEKVQESLDRMRTGDVKGKRLIIAPHIY